MDGRKIFACSPRLSLIYKIDALRTLKLSYARSFVDAPYFYRCNTLPTFMGSESLQSEYLSTVQLSYAFRSQTTGFSYEGNLFYNHLTDFIYLNQAEPLRSITWNGENHNPCCSEAPTLFFSVGYG